MTERLRQHRLDGYAVALAGFAAAYVLRVMLDPWLGERALFLLFTLPVLASLLYAGAGPAIACSLLSLVYGLLHYRSGGVETGEILHLATYAFVCSGIIVLANRMRATEQIAVDRKADADVHGRRAAQYAEELNLLVEGATDYAIFMTDSQGGVTIWNKGAERVLGWTEAEIIGQPCDVLYPSDEREEGKPASDLGTAMTNGHMSETMWLVRKNGTEFLADVTITPLSDRNGALRGFAKIIHDVTDRQASDLAIERREKLLEAVLATVPDAMVVIDESGQIRSFSRTAEQTFGYSEDELVGRNVNVLMPSPDHERHNGYLKRYLETGERRIIGIGRVVTGLRKDGTPFPMELAVGEARTEGERLFTGFIRDLTEKRQDEAHIQELQSELLHVARLSAMGTMASTLAHELNQPLTAIAAYAEAAEPLIADPDAAQRALLREILQDLAAQALRAGSIVRRLREFVSRGEIEKQIEDLPRLISDAAQLALMGSRENGVSAKIELDPAAANILADRVQIQQVLTNLIRNALDAMEKSERRELTISTKANGATMVAISVSDTGSGIAPEISEKLFQAFSSTKGNGMGLGLSICRTIVEAHGGRIEAFPNPVGGTTFRFTLPAVQGDG